MKIWKELKQRVEKGVETASQKSQQMVEISRLNLRIRGKKEDINRLYRRLGILVYEAWNEDKEERLVLSGDMKEILHLIRQFQADITALEQELLSVRGKVNCPDCGAVFDRGTAICPVCRSPIPQVMPPSPDDRNTAAEPQAKASSHQRQSEPFVSQTGSSDKNEAADGERTTVVLEKPRALAEFQTVVGESIFVCPECGNQLKELVDTCPFCGERFL